MSKIINMGVTDDVKDNLGNWRKIISNNNMKWETLSYRRWYSIKARCRENGTYQANKPSYVGCKNNFRSFNEFVEWSRKQVGYDLEGYHLDKDLLFKGNKIYSPDTCVFLPLEINSLFIKRNSGRGEYPIGVSWSKRSKKFISQCSIGSGKLAYLGYFDCPVKAFNTYKSHKELVIKNMADKYKDVIDVRAYNALITYRVEITD